MYHEKPIPVYHAKDELEPEQICISTAGTKDRPFDKLIEEYRQLINETDEELIDKFNSIGCTSFILPSEQIKSLIELYEKENEQ